jgi:recombination protein RecR
MTYPQHLLRLISVLKNLPGIGSKSAERFAFHLLELPPEKLKEMGLTIGEVKENLKECHICGALADKQGCSFCTETSRDQETICVVSSAKEIFLVEATRTFRGLYHVLKKPTPQSLEKLKARLVALKTREVILAFDATISGDSAALFLKKELAALPLTLSRIAFGIPLGSSLDHLDGGTLAKALQGRHLYK